MYYIQSYIDSGSFAYPQSATDYDTIQNSPKIVNNFMIYLEHLSHTSDQELVQFGINNAADLAKILKQAYHNLQHSDIDF